MKEEITPIEEAIMKLAEYIELIPCNDYKVSEDIGNILGWKWKPKK